MNVEICDFCGVNIKSRLVSYCDGRPVRLKISKVYPSKEAVEVQLCGKCHESLLSSIAKNSRKEWKQEAKQQLRELFP